MVAEGHHLERSSGHPRKPRDHTGRPFTQLIKQNWEHHLETLPGTMEFTLSFQDSAYPLYQTQGLKLHKSAPGHLSWVRMLPGSSTQKSSTPFLMYHSAGPIWASTCWDSLILTGINVYFWLRFKFHLYKTLRTVCRRCLLLTLCFT